MESPFPGMDPWLKHPALWSDVHNRLLVAISDAVVPLIAPRYYVALGHRTYLDLVDTGENYLEIHDVETGKLVTILEILSPTSKLHSTGRAEYKAQRNDVLRSRTSLVEIDLLRAGEPVAAIGDLPRSDYRIIVNRGHARSQTALWPFGIEDPIPSIPVPLMSEEPEPTLALNAVWHALYVRARFDLRVDYRKEPVPSLWPEQAALARKFIAGLRTEGPAGEGTERA